MGAASSLTTSTTIKKEPGTPALINSTVQMNDWSQLMQEGKCFNYYK